MKIFNYIWKSFFFFNSQLYYAAEKKEGIPTFCDSMDGTGDYYAKCNKPVSERQIPYDLTYKSNLMNKIN